MSNVIGKKLELLASAARTVTTTGNAVSLPSNAKDIGILHVATADASAGTFAATLETSWDGGDTWVAVTGAAPGAKSAVGGFYAAATINCSNLVRAVLTAATSPVQTNEVFVVFNEGN